MCGLYKLMEQQTPEYGDGVYLSHFRLDQITNGMYMNLSGCFLCVA